MDIKELLKTKKRVFFIGIGGISMSGLAMILKQDGYEVGGSDSTQSRITDTLKENGIDIKIGHNKNNIDGYELIINTAAVHSDNEEMKAAMEKNLPVFERTYLLGALIDNYKCPIGVAGTHGKTTTSAMISEILLYAKKNPTFSVGGIVNKTDSNLHIGDKDYFVFESCEYVNSFLNFHPKISVILNIEEDHLDFFKDIDDIINSFSKYIDNTTQDGCVVVPYGNLNVNKALKNKSVKTYTYGINCGDICAKDIVYLNNLPSYKVYENNKFLAQVNLSVYGEHNITNSLAAFACCLACGIEPEIIAKALSEFKTTKRRFEKVGSKNGIDVFDDYAHHPSEIDTTVKTLKTLGYKNIWYVFQPHTYTRTIALKDEFVRALKECDNLVLTKIYPAREENIYNITGEYISSNIENAVYIEDFDDVCNYLLSHAEKGDCIITVGAGNVNEICDMILKKLL